MTSPADFDARTAWNAAVSANALMVAVTLVAFIAFPAPLHSVLTGARVAQLVSSTVWLLVLLRQWHEPRLRLSLAAFGLAPLPQLVMLAVLAVMHEAAGWVFEPLARQRLFVLIVAVFTPRQFWVPVLMIAAIAIEACLEFWVPGLGATKNFAPHDPWLTLATAALAIWIAYSRARLLSRERALQTQLREAADAARMGKMALAIRDLANSPLQVLELQMTLLEERHQPVLPETGPMRRALGRLKELSQILATHEHPGDLHDAKDLLSSLDAVALLRDLLREHRLNIDRGTTRLAERLP
jgi:hypothetical protein